MDFHQDHHVCNFANLYRRNLIFKTKKLCSVVRIDFRDGSVVVGPGEMFVVYKGVELKPFAAIEARVLLVEPRGVVNTGAAGETKWPRTMSGSRRTGEHLDLFFPEWQGYGENSKVFDGALTIRERLTPEIAFREVTVPYREELNIEHGVLGYGSVRQSLRFARDLIAEADPSTIFMIGGTCGAEIGPISFLNRKYDGDMSILWFDAHGDLNTPETSPSGHFHGMPLRVLLGEGPEEIRSLAFSRLSPAQVLLAGARELDPAEHVYIETNGVAHFGPGDLSAAEALIAKVKSMGHPKIYIHLDLDVLEPKDFPHLLVPSPGGILFEHLLALLERLRENFSVVGSSIVEYVPTDGGGPG